jgi:hypothetical protein
MIVDRPTQLKDSVGALSSRIVNHVICRGELQLRQQSLKPACMSGGLSACSSGVQSAEHRPMLNTLR